MLAECGFAVPRVSAALGALGAPAVTLARRDDVEPADEAV
jgi:hypothetical protein